MGVETSAMAADAEVAAAVPRLRGARALLSAARFLGDPIGTTQRVFDRFGAVSQIRLPFGSAGGGPLTFMFGIGPRFNERVLSDVGAFRTSGLMLQGPRNSAQRRIRDGIIGMNGPRHVHYRKMLLPPLRRPTVDAMIARMSKIAQSNVETWPRGETIDLWPRARRLAQDIAISLLFTAEGDGDHVEAHHAADLINEHVRLNGRPLVAGCPLDIPGLPFHEMMRSAEKLEAYLGPWAMKRKGDPRRDDLMSIVVNSDDEKGAPSSDALINSQILTLFGAAYETCQTALVWTLYLVAQHPEVAHKLYDEIAALPEDPQLLAAELNKCTWLDAVVRESMRVLPPVPIQMRVATRDTDFGDHEVRQGTRIVISPYLTNRMPDIYAEPDRFRPERWAGIDPDQYQYLVFSAASRTCPGAWFGTTLVKVSLIHVLRSLRVEILPGARIDRHVSITMSPKRGMPVRLHAQDRRFGRSPVSGHIAEMVAL